MRLPRQPPGWLPAAARPCAPADPWDPRCRSGGNCAAGRARCPGCADQPSSFVESLVQSRGVGVLETGGGVGPTGAARNRSSFTALPFIPPKALLMRHFLLKAAVALPLLALSLGACQTDTGTGVASGVAGGAVIGAIVGGPVGAAVGGVAGAAVGGILTAEETRRVRTYVATQRSPSIQVAEPVRSGEARHRSHGLRRSRPASAFETRIATRL